VNITAGLARADRLQRSRLFKIIASAVLAVLAIGGLVAYAVAINTPSESMISVPEPVAPAADGSVGPTAAPGDQPSPSGAATPAELELDPEAQIINRLLAAKSDPTSVAVGAGKMCLDTCYSQSKCERRGREGEFKCDGAKFEEGMCQPIAPGLACLPQAMFIRGTRQVGDCCAATGDGNAGDECEGNRCVSIGENGVDNPFVCSHWCDLTKDCPSGTVCSPFNSCVPPIGQPYTCK